MFMVIGAIVFIFIVATMIVSRRSQVFKERLRASESARALLKDQNQALEKELVALHTKARALQDQVNHLVAERDNLMSLATRSGTNRPKNVVEVLLQSGRLTKEGLQKASDYKQKTRSPYSIEELLVLLDQVSAEEIKVAKRQLGDA